MRYKTKTWYNTKTGEIIEHDRKPGREWKKMGKNSLIFWSKREECYKPLHRLGRDIYNFLSLLKKSGVPCDYDDALKLLRYHRAMKNITWFPKQIRLLHSDPEAYVNLFTDILRISLFMGNYGRVKRVLKSIFELEKILGITIFDKLPEHIISATFKVLNS